jgi:hypothetical protein
MQPLLLLALALALAAALLCLVCWRRGLLAWLSGIELDVLEPRRLAHHKLEEEEGPSPA